MAVITTPGILFTGSKNPAPFGGARKNLGASAYNGGAADKAVTPTISF
jgi:hypothetical protein